MSVADVCNRLRARDAVGAEAEIQADVRDLLINGQLNIGDAQVRLETPAPNRRRIDVEVGLTVIEVKKNLDKGNVLKIAEDQLGGYVRDRTHELGQRYTGILTDGLRWRLYHWQENLGLIFVLEHRLKAGGDDALLSWLEGVLATQRDLKPTPSEVSSRLGAGGSAHALERATLLGLWRAHAGNPSCQLKRELWSRMLRTALGTRFEDEDELFVEHTYLVLVAELVAHALVGFNIDDPNRTPSSLASGSAFRASQIQGVVEEDFFDWVVEIPGGDIFVRTLAKRLSRFRWEQVEHDVLKVLYESVIDAGQRKKLGEYYTPDWLAQRMVAEVYIEPLTTRVLDPSCGSGTFLFHLVRAYIEEAEAQGLLISEYLPALTNTVIGMDVHPVAVTLARVTYLMAIGSARLKDSSRPRMNIPVYLGDSLRWRADEDVWAVNGVKLNATDPGATLPGFADELFFPARTLEDAGRFDSMVAELSNKASQRTRGSLTPTLKGLFTRYAIHADDQPFLQRTFEVLCQLHDQRRDHIWGYYARNTARPYWLAEPENRVDMIIGNVPWLAYRFMSVEMQALFKTASQNRGLWAGAQMVTHQDLSAYFLVRTAELYLKESGTFFVLMPLGVITRQQYAGFRSGRYEGKGNATRFEFDVAWDLHDVDPPIFPMPAAAVRGRKISPIETMAPARSTG
jgi:N-6 DNA Methylase